MIGRLTGTLVSKAPPSLMVDVNGVGYEVEAPMTVFYDLPGVGEKVALHTHLVVREDAQLLYGFTRESQRQLFRNLIKVNGVGPRVALAILSGMNENEFAQCVSNEDVVRMIQVPGIGRKTAERLIVEMRDKVSGEVSQIQAEPRSADAAQEAVKALMTLGYKPQEASRMVRELNIQDLGTEDIIRQALKSVAG